jgi:hypothetical protein
MYHHQEPEADETYGFPDLDEPDVVAMQDWQQLDESDGVAMQGWQQLAASPWNSFDDVPGTGDALYEIPVAGAMSSHRLNYETADPVGAVSVPLSPAFVQHGEASHEAIVQASSVPSPFNAGDFAGQPDPAMFAHIAQKFETHDSHETGGATTAPPATPQPSLQQLPGLHRTPADEGAHTRPGSITGREPHGSAAGFGLRAPAEAGADCDGGAEARAARDLFGEYPDDPDYSDMDWAVETFREPRGVFCGQTMVETKIKEAARNGHVAKVTRLLELYPQAKINATRAGGSNKTALHCAADGGFLKTCTVLLERGANPFKKDGAGKMPLDYAKAKRYKNLTTTLQDTMARMAANIRRTPEPA